MTIVANCPHCGNQLWQITLDDPRFIADRCPECKRTISANVLPYSESTKGNIDKYLSGHFGDLEVPTAKSDIGSWPDEFSSYFPRAKPRSPGEPVPDWETELFGVGQADAAMEQDVQAEPNFTDREREEAHRRMLRSHGLNMSVDSQGLRITSPTSNHNRGSSDLSPYDIVRLASELDGGVVSLEERLQCPQCQAIVSPKDTVCQWCSTSVK